MFIPYIAPFPQPDIYNKKTNSKSSFPNRGINRIPYKSEWNQGAECGPARRRYKAMNRIRNFKQISWE